MNNEQMIQFAREQLEIFSKDSQMGVFLQGVIEKLENPEKYEIGDIVEDRFCDTRGIIIDTEVEDGHWCVLNEVGCVETWIEREFKKVGHTESVKGLFKEMHC